MSDPRPNMQRLFNDEKDIDSLKQMAEAKFEEEIVNYLFSRYDLPRSVRSQMLRTQRDQVGRPGLTLDAFNEAFPAFPIYLVAVKLEKVRDQNPVHKIWMDFANRKFVKEFEKLKDLVPGDVTTYGLVFHWGFLKATGRQKVDERASGMVIHNREPRIDLIGSFRGYCRPRRGSERLYLESLSALLTTIDKESPGGKWVLDD